MLYFLDRNSRTAKRYEISFDAVREDLDVVALDQLSAEVDRVLGRGQRSLEVGDIGPDRLEEAHESQEELHRVLGELRKAGVLVNKSML